MTGNRIQTAKIVKKSNDTNNNVKGFHPSDARNMDERPIPTIGAAASATAVGARRGDNERKNEWDAHDDSVLICSRLGALCNHDLGHAFVDVERDLRNVRKARTNRA